jgi:hypothetical protein
MIVRVGHKGKFLGVVGVFRTGNAAKPFDLHYQLVAMGEEYETPKGREANHPVLKLLDNYAKEVKDQNFLGRVPQRPVPISPVLTQLGIKPPSYVGTDKCITCHQHQIDSTAATWQKSKHAQAYTALSKVASKPALRQYDPECITCHVVGYGYQGGFVSHRQTPSMENVGCESCHGPGSAHANAPQNPQFRLAMSPWKGNNPNDRLPALAVLQQGTGVLTPPQLALYNRINSDMCQKCHDPENDPHFKFEKYWPQIMHGKPAPQPPAAAQKR